MVNRGLMSRPSFGILQLLSGAARNLCFVGATVVYSEERKWSPARTNGRVLLLFGHQMLIMGIHRVF